MKLNSISIGGGLALVAVGLLANAAASLVGSPDRTANADDLKRAAKNPQPVADVAVSRADEGGAEMVAMGDSGGCIWGEPLDWFGEIRELPDCAIDGYAVLGFQTLDTGLLDVNHDGVHEGLKSIFSNWTGNNREWIVCEDGQNPLIECGVWADDWRVVGGAWVLVRHCVLSADRLITFAQQRMPVPAFGLKVQNGGWRDIDFDGDLDLALFLVADDDGAAPPNPVLQKAVWIENTGYEATQPLVGDLDGDGSVGASDLTMLLGGWTGN